MVKHFYIKLSIIYHTKVWFPDSIICLYTLLEPNGHIGFMKILYKFWNISLTTIQKIFEDSIFPCPCSIKKIHFKW